MGWPHSAQTLAPWPIAEPSMLFPIKNTQKHRRKHRRKNEKNKSHVRNHGRRPINSRERKSRPISRPKQRMNPFLHHWHTQSAPQNVWYGPNTRRLWSWLSLYVDGYCFPCWYHCTTEGLKARRNLWLYFSVAWIRARAILLEWMMIISSETYTGYGRYPAGPAAAVATTPAYRCFYRHSGSSCTLPGDTAALLHHTFRWYSSITAPHFLCVYIMYALGLKPGVRDGDDGGRARATRAMARPRTHQISPPEIVT